MLCWKQDGYKEWKEGDPGSATLSQRIEFEDKAVVEQEQAGTPVLRRLRGDPGICARHFVTERVLCLNDFCTFGAPTAASTPKVISSCICYFEIEIIKVGLPPARTLFGFAASSFQTGDESFLSQFGVGLSPFADSWAVDCNGNRLHKDFSDGLAWECDSWSKGDVIGLAANLNEEKIAVTSLAERILLSTWLWSRLC